jgi:hypothetical protein
MCSRGATDDRGRRARLRADATGDGLSRFNDSAPGDYRQAAVALPKALRTRVGLAVCDCESQHRRRALVRSRSESALAVGDDAVNDAPAGYRVPQRC